MLKKKKKNPKGYNQSAFKRNNKGQTATIEIYSIQNGRIRMGRVALRRGNFLKELLKEMLKDRMWEGGSIRISPKSRLSRIVENTSI